MGVINSMMRLYQLATSKSPTQHKCPDNRTTYIVQPSVKARSLYNCLAKIPITFVVSGVGVLGKARTPCTLYHLVSRCINVQQSKALQLYMVSSPPNCKLPLMITRESPSESNSGNYAKRYGLYRARLCTTVLLLGD